MWMHPVGTIYRWGRIEKNIAKGFIQIGIFCSVLTSALFCLNWFACLLLFVLFFHTLGVCCLGSYYCLACSAVLGLYVTFSPSVARSCFVTLLLLWDSVPICLDVRVSPLPLLSWECWSLASARPLFFGVCSFLLFLGGLRSWLLLVLPCCSSRCCLTVPVLVDESVWLVHAVLVSLGFVRLFL